MKNIYFQKNPHIYKVVSLCILAFNLLLQVNNLNAQVGINIADPEDCAVLQVYSETKGVLLPEITNESNIDEAPCDGLLYYSPNDKKFRFYNAEAEGWRNVNPWNEDDDGNVSIENNVSGDTIKANIFDGYGIIPVGGIIMWSGLYGDWPDNWALCDGSTIPINGELRSLPDLTDRFILGAVYVTDETITYLNMNDTGGNHERILKESHLPVHKHSTNKLEILDGYNEINYGYGSYKAKIATPASPGQIGETAYAGGEMTGASSYTNPSPTPGPCQFEFICTARNSNPDLFNDFQVYSSHFFNSEPPPFLIDYSGTYLGYHYNEASRIINGVYEDVYFNTNISIPVDIDKINLYYLTNCITNNDFFPNHEISGCPEHNPNYPVGGQVPVSGNSVTEAFDNRPAYYTLAFIMRIY